MNETMAMAASIPETALVGIFSMPEAARALKASALPGSLTQTPQPQSAEAHRSVGAAIE